MYAKLQMKSVAKALLSEIKATPSLLAAILQKGPEVVLIGEASHGKLQIFRYPTPCKTEAH
jgi:erythromycin esterase-like protein